MNDQMRQLNDGSDADDRPGHGRLIARMDEPQALSPAQMEDRALIRRSDALTPEVEAFRELRTRLLAMASGNFVTLVAPVSRGCGGSFIARNLAAAMAFDETKSALLIDCDLRSPSQHDTLEIEPVNGGLIDLLEAREAHIPEIVYKTGVPRLRLLPAGNTREIGAEYFSSVRMRLLIDSLRSRYSDRYIFLDAPPVRGAPDARILSDIADLVVLVAGYGHDTPSAIAQAAANFDPSKFAGVVFNEGV